MIKITGNVPQVQRVITGLYSFDLAFQNREGNKGFPLNTVTEVFGPTGAGKSTMSYGLAGILAKEAKTNIALADFEGFDSNFLGTVLENSGFDGEVNYIQEREDETSLDILISSLLDKKAHSKYGIGILDSIGAISPIAEAEGDLGEANMGRRARLLAQFARKSVHVLRNAKTPKAFILINHMHPIIGARGFSTPGGETVKYLSTTRIRIKRKEEFADGSYVLEGIVVKNRYGYRDRKFYLFILSGRGIHLGLSWMYDAILNNVATRERGIIKIGDTTIGRLKPLITETSQLGNEPFIPFRDALQNVVITETDEEEPEKEDE